MSSSTVGGASFIAYSRIGKDGRVTIPATIRRQLNLHPGDEIIFAQKLGRIVLLRKRAPLDIPFLRGVESTLDEWNSANDDHAFRDL